MIARLILILALTLGASPVLAQDADFTLVYHRFFMRVYKLYRVFKRQYMAVTGGIAIEIKMKKS